MGGIRRVSALWFWVAALGCGGQAGSTDATGGSGASTESGGTGAFGGASDGGTATTSDGSSSGGTNATGGHEPMGSPYVPSGPQVSLTGDGRLEGGSFQDQLRDGWDFCGSRTPGGSYVREGDRDITPIFDPEVTKGLIPTSPTSSADAQLAFWLGESLPGGEPYFLYFEARRTRDIEQSGVLSVAATTGCGTDELLAEISLGELALTDDWATRCVTLNPIDEFREFGFWVTGEDYALSLDWFRFGPPCHFDE